MGIFGYNQQPSLSIIENILCSLPIKEAMRTSILSRNWRYNWTGIPKLVFSEDVMFGEDTSDKANVCPLERKRKIVSAIRQVQILHRGPIFEFSVSMLSFTNVELDQIIHDLARNKDALKKLTIHFCYENYIGFGSLTSLYFHSCNVSSKAILHLLSNCPFLTRLKLAFKREAMYKWECITFHELSKCLPVIEHLSFSCMVIESMHGESFQLRYSTSSTSLLGTVLCDGSHLPLLCHVFRSSPNLEKIKLTACHTVYDSDNSKLESNMRGCSDIWLENLKELKILCFVNSEGQSRFVKLILAKSPVLKKVILKVWFPDADRQSEILRPLL